jgi:hypothetical protein
MSTGKRAATHVVIGVGEGALVLRQLASHVPCGQRPANQNPSLLLISTDISSPNSSQNACPPQAWPIALTRVKQKISPLYTISCQHSGG